MEKDMFFRTEDNTFVPIWNSSSFGVEIQPNELNCHSEQLPNFFFNPNWDNSMVQSNPFESSLSSMVSSPAASIAAVPGGGGGHFGLIEYELMPGGLTPRMESGKISRASSNLCIKICGSPMGLLGNRNGFSHDGKSDSDNKFSRNSTSSTPENAEFGDFGGESSVSEQIPCGEIAMKGQNDANAKKRKSIPRGKAKETPLFSRASYARVATWSDDELIAKRSKVGEALGNEKDGEKSKAEASEKGKLGSENGNKKQSKDGEKSPEPPKDYIHLRARRGQATDSHSLAERVRREKIGERMKFLQDLVPGCNKVMGKAVMLDEIINYVQSLQQQVEFLSLKLANVNPRMGLNIEALLSKEIFQSCESAPPNIYPFVYQSPHGPFLRSCILNPNETENSSLAIRNLSMQLLPAGGFGEASSQAQWLAGDMKVEL